MKSKLVFLMMLLSFNAKALDSIPQDFRGEWLPSNEECVGFYMDYAENVNGWRIDATYMGGYEWGSDLIKGTGELNTLGVFTAKFKDTYLGENDGKSIKTFTKTSSNGMRLTNVSLTSKNKTSDKFIRCTVDDYKATMHRLGGIFIDKPLHQKDADFGKEKAKAVLLHYNKEPRFGLKPLDIVKPSSSNGSKPVVMRNGNQVNISVGNAVHNVFNSIFKSK